MKNITIETITNDTIYAVEIEDADSGWRPGDAPWDAPGMSASDFI